MRITVKLWGFGSLLLANTNVKLSHVILGSSWSLWVIVSRIPCYLVLHHFNGCWWVQDLSFPGWNVSEHWTPLTPTLETIESQKHWELRTLETLYLRNEHWILKALNPGNIELWEHWHSPTTLPWVLDLWWHEPVSDVTQWPATFGSSSRR